MTALKDLLARSTPASHRNEPGAGVHLKGCEVPAQLRLYGHARKCYCATMTRRAAVYASVLSSDGSAKR